MRLGNLKPIPILVILATMFLASRQLGFAGMVTPITSAQVFGCIGGGPSCSVLDFIQVADPGGVAQLNVSTYGSTAAGVVATVSAIGQAGYGVMRGSSFSSFNITGVNLSAGTLAQVGFIDIITISFAPWNGQPGLLGINYTLDGQISSTGTGDGFAKVGVQLGDPAFGVASYGALQGYTSSTSGSHSLPTAQFTYGQPFFLEFEMFVGAGTMTPGGPNDGYCNCFGNGQGSGNAQFFNTLILSGLNPTDMNGNAAVGAQFSSGSGTQYSTSGVVPEPSTLVLILLGFAALAVRRMSEWLPKLQHLMS